MENALRSELLDICEYCGSPCFVGISNLCCVEKIEEVEKEVGRKDSTGKKFGRNDVFYFPGESSSEFKVFKIGIIKFRVFPPKNIKMVNGSNNVKRVFQISNKQGSNWRKVLSFNSTYHDWSLVKNEQEKNQLMELLGILADNYFLEQEKKNRVNSVEKEVKADVDYALSKTRAAELIDAVETNEFEGIQLETAFIDYGKTEAESKEGLMKKITNIKSTSKQQNGNTISQRFTFTYNDGGRNFLSNTKVRYKILKFEADGEKRKYGKTIISDFKIKTITIGKGINSGRGYLEGLEELIKKELSNS